MYLTELLDGAASRWPHKPALIDGDNIISYAGLVDDIAGWTSQLHALGVTSGARVGLCHPNSITYVALTFALWRARAVVVPIPAECAEEEVSTIATAMRLEAILGQKPRGPSVAIQPEVHFTRLAPVVAADNHGLNIAFIRFTSGTTSARKGVVLCHETVRNRIMAANQALRIGSDDTVMWCLPMSHHFLVTIVLYLSQGATIVLARHVLAGLFLDAVNRWRGTVLYAAPFHYALLARDASGAGLSSVRLAVSTTCGLPQEVAGDFHRRFGLPLAQALGVIELGLVCANVDDPLGRWNSVGRPLPDFAVTIVNPDAAGCGEIRVAGPGLFDAYAEPWTPREQVMPDGWFGTGDIGRVDAEGYLYLLSRKTAVINLAGRKVFPEEIEAVLNRHPAVRESRVYGAAHPHLGEVIEAEVALCSAVEPRELREFCRAHIGPDKIPNRIQIVPGVARTAVTGKVRRPASLPVP
jgi:long-chain acyl-CoA synthetase